MRIYFNQGHECVIPFKCRVLNLGYDWNMMQYFIEVEELL